MSNQLVNEILNQIDSNAQIDQKQLTKLLDNSTFARLFAQQYQELFIEALTQPLIEDYSGGFDAFKNKNHHLDDSKLMRLFRKFHCISLMHQMINGKIDFQLIAKHLSMLADTLIVKTLEETLKEVKVNFKLTNLPTMNILALGKLGGMELNFSSDVDLIFLYDERLITEFDPLKVYTSVAQLMIHKLNQFTVDGFVYRVDMRLRPFGDGAPLVCSVKTFQSYCVKHAREWERYALIKARQLTITKNNKRIEHIISNFVYRNYIDYSVLEAIRSMKDKILKEMQKDKLKFNVKLGRGGIREIEFVVQCYQLIYGGQNRHLRTYNLYTALVNLAKYKHIEQHISDQLWKNYVFLRDLENAMQMIDDQQVHHLPKAEANQNRLVQLLGFLSWGELESEYQLVSKQVQESFDLLTNFNEVDSEVRSIDLSLDQKVKSNDREIGVFDKIELFQLKLKKNKKISSHTHALLNEIILLISIEINDYSTESQAFIVDQMTKLLGNIIKRSTYLHLLVESKKRLKYLFEIMMGGEWFCQKIIQHPHLLETALFLPDDHKLLYLNKSDYKELLIQRLNQVSLDDKEEYLEVLRRFKTEQVFKVAVAEYKRALTLMETSDVLSALAEAFIDQVLEYAWVKIKEKLSLTDSDYNQLKSSLSVIAYGKLGGFELGFNSDLDLIFLYQLGEKIPNYAKIFAKVVQFFVSVMQTQTYSGKLYYIDLRLRPSGETGLLVSSIDAFRDYQYQQAWVWEHQALTRARWVGGSVNLIDYFEHIRYQVLSKERNSSELKAEVRQMREKINQSLYKPKAGFFNLKYSPGGMIDIEFIAQFMALTYTKQHKEISVFTDNIRIFQSMETANLLSLEETQILVEAYCYYRDLSYDCLFKNEPLLVEIRALKPYDSQVKVIYQKWLY